MTNTELPGRIRIAAKGGKAHFENPDQEGGDAATLCGKGADYISATTDAAECANCLKMWAKREQDAARTAWEELTDPTDEDFIAGVCSGCGVAVLAVHEMWIGIDGDEVCAIDGMHMVDTVTTEPITFRSVGDAVALLESPPAAPLPVRKRAHAAHDAYLASIVITSNCHVCGPRDAMGCGHCYPADANGLVIVDSHLIAEWWASRYTAADSPSGELFFRTRDAVEQAYPEFEATETLAKMAETGLSCRAAFSALVAERYPLVCQEQTHTPCEYRTDTVAAMRYHVARAHGDDTSALWLDSLTDPTPDSGTCCGCGSDGEIHDANCLVAGPPRAANELQETLAPWEVALLQAYEPVAASKITEALAPAGSRHGDHVRDYAIGYVPEYRGHWSGVAWVSHHGYGLQIHMTLDDARNWCAGRVAFEGRSDLVAAPIKPMVLRKHKASKRGK